MVYKTLSYVCQSSSYALISALHGEKGLLHRLTLLSKAILSIYSGFCYKIWSEKSPWTISTINNTMGVLIVRDIHEGYFSGGRLCHKVKILLHLLKKK